MKINFTRKKILITISSILFIVLGYVIYINVFTLYITSFTPNLSNISYQTYFIRVTFNKSIDKKSLTLLDDTDVLIKDKTIIREHEVVFYLDTNKLSVDNQTGFNFSIKSVDGYEINDRLIQFTPRDIPYEKLSREEQRVMKEVEQQKPAYYKDPILNYIPYSTLNYEIKPNFIKIDENTSDLAITIRVFLSNVDIKTGEQAAIDLHTQQAKDYITSKGLDVNSYYYEIRTIKP